MKLQYSSKYKLITRFLSVPFVFALMLITHNLFVLHRIWSFILRGGEFINYDDKNEPATILEIYKELKENRNEKTN